MFYVKQLTNSDIIKIYTTLAPLHFPEEELRPLLNLQSLIDRNGYEGLGLYREANHELVGYAFFIKVPDITIALLDYYAILENHRCQGLGSIFLAQIRAHYHNLQGILLETEDFDTAITEEELSIRKRRDTFYCKNGARRTSIKSTVFDVPFQIFFIPTKEDLNDKILRKDIEGIYRFMLTKELYQKHVQWRP